MNNWTVFPLRPNGPKKKKKNNNNNFAYSRSDPPWGSGKNMNKTLVPILATIWALIWPLVDTLPMNVILTSSVGIELVSSARVTSFYFQPGHFSSNIGHQVASLAYLSYKLGHQVESLALLHCLGMPY